MHVEIEAVCRRGLRIIDEIPSISLCKIEGYNGIGKTSAIRLLELCTGQQPFKGNAFAWATFRNQLVSARVRITDLREANEIEWFLSPGESWPKEPLGLGSDIGRITINGKQETLSSVESLLRIHHFNTTETPAMILAERAKYAGDIIDRWYSRTGQSRGQDIDRALAKARSLLAQAHVTEVRLAREVATSSQAAVLDVGARASKARHRITLLAKAVEVADQLDTVRGTGPQVALQLQDAEHALAALDRHKDDLNEEIAQAQIRRHLTEQAEASLARAQNLVERRRRALNRARADLAEAALAANVKPTHTAVNATIKTVEARLAELVEERPLASEAPAVLAVLGSLLRHLDDAIANNLQDSVLIDAESGREGWTTVALRDAVRKKIDKVSERNRGSDAETIANTIAQTRKRLDLLVTVRESLKSADRASTLVTEAEAALLEAAADVKGGSTDRLDQLLAQRNSLESDGRELQSRMDRLRNELSLLGGGKTEEALAAELDLMCRETETEPARVRGTLEREQARAHELNQQETQATLKANVAAQQLNESLSTLESTVKSLVEDQELEWLRRTEPAIRELPGSDLDRKLMLIDQVTLQLNEAGELLQSTVGSTQSISGALHELSERLRGSGDIKQEQTWTEPANLWLGNQARQWLDDRIMRETLFEGGGDIRLNVNSLTVSWMSNGNRSYRPLAAFSSGQQTFAFTRARVAQLDESSNEVPNRMIVLDEFGAYLDRQRSSALAQYLSDRKERVPNDQVLVILPWGAASETDQADPLTVARRAKELARRGYFAEAFGE